MRVTVRDIAQKFEDIEYLGIREIKVHSERKIIPRVREI